MSYRDFKGVMRPGQNKRRGRNPNNPNSPNNANNGNSGAQFATNSSYFRLTSFVTIGSTEFNLYSLLYQDATGSVRPLLRSYTPD